ncbi:MAG: S41 family peptidase [Henriciella sp.]
MTVKTYILGLLWVASLSMMASAAQTAEQTRLLRHPDVSQTQIVFSYADDLWLVDRAGGQATRLTSAKGVETHPKFSPDGKFVAFTAPYADGNEDIYVLPVTGGVPQRVTRHPAYDKMIDWHPDGSRILYASDMNSERKRYNQLFVIERSGGMPEQLPMPYGEMAVFSPDGTSILYSYLKDFQNQPDLNRETFKRYKGGRAPDIWRYDFATKSSSRLTDNEYSDSAPMWTDQGIFFLSERDSQRSNIWTIDPSGEPAARPVTHMTEDDVTRPSAGPGAIVYEYDADLYLLDLTSRASTKVNISAVADHLILSDLKRNIGDRILSTDLSPDGQIALFSARGELVSYKSESKVTRLHAPNSGIADRYASYSPDQKSIAYVSDASGEYQLHVRDLSSNTVRQLTHFDSGLLYRPFWSPDGSKIAISDSRQKLYIIEVVSGAMTEIDQGLWNDHFGMEAFSVNWSPDSLWLTWSRGTENRNQVIFAYNTSEKAKHALTSGYYNDAHPVFSEDGNYLYFLTQRRLNPIYSDIDFTWAYANSTVLAAMPLRKGLPAPGGTEAVDPQTDIQIDLDDLEARIVLLDAPSGAYTALFFDNGNLIVHQRANAGDLSGKSMLGLVNPDGGNVTNVAEGVDRLLDVASGTALVQARGEYFRVKLAADQKLNQALPVKDFIAPYDRQAEAQQIIWDAWRFQRDYFYDDGLHKADWNGARDRALALVPHIITESDLSFVIREQAGELSAGHVWAVGSPRVRYTYNKTGLLGADFERQNGAFRLSKIYDAGPRSAEWRSPLHAPGIDVDEGDYLLAVNGTLLADEKDPWGAFEGVSGKAVELTVSATPRMQDARTVVVETLENDDKLRELAWVEANRQFVDAASDGRIGYIFVPDTSRNGQDELMRQYRAQYTKEALVIDERFNSGGALGDRLVELLNRPPLVYFSVRNGRDYPLPELSHRGPKVMLTNGWSYSGGDGFPLLFKQAGVGKLIGTRTWGGLIGPAMSVPFVSGGRVAAPPQRVYTPDGEWAGTHGVVPDVFLENDPGELMKGRDQQLEYAVEDLLHQLESLAPRQYPTFPSELPD